MPRYISPEGNCEMCKEKPAGYLTGEEWTEAHKDEIEKAGRLARIAEIKRRLDSIDNDKLKMYTFVNMFLEDPGAKQRFLAAVKEANDLKDPLKKELSELEALNG